MNCLLDWGIKALRGRISKLLFSIRIIWELLALTKSSAIYAILGEVKDEGGFWERGKRDAQRLCKFINRDSIVLDLGCGIGRMIKFVAPKCREVHGVDISALMLRRAKKNLKGLNNCFLHRGDCRRLSMFPDDMFDLVYSFFVLQHMEKEDAYLCLKSIHRVLKPGGIAYLQFPNLLSDRYFSDFEEYVIRRTRFAARVRFYTRPEIEILCSRAGLKPLEYEEENGDLFYTCYKHPLK